MTPVEMSLDVMWKGMVSIIIVIAIIIVCTYLLQFINNKYDSYKKSKTIKEIDNNMGEKSEENK